MSSSSFSGSKNSVHSWPCVIENFSKLPKQVGHKVLASPHTIGNRTFLIQVYPGGFLDKNKEYVSVYLELCEPSRLVVNFTLSILNIEGDKVVTKPITTHEFGCKSHDEIAWGWSQLVQYSFLADKILPVTNDQLIILCEFFDMDEFESPYMRQRLYSYGKYLNNEDCSDVKIIVRGRTIHAHKVVLISGNEVFASMFEHDCQESRENVIKIDDVEFEVMLELMRFIYTGQVCNIEKVANGLLIAADKYGIGELKSRCEKYLCRVISSYNVIDLMTLADRYRLAELEKEALNSFMAHRTKIVKSCDFIDKLKQMDVNLIARIITNLSDQLG